jgi:hypothetical protein
MGFMKLPGWVPRPASWASGIALYVFSLGVSAAFALIVPRLFELMPHSPRLAWLGMVIVWIAPIPVAAMGHRFAHGVLDLVDHEGGRRDEDRKPSLWAGFVAWAAILFATSTTGLIMLVLDPPPLDPDALGLLALMTRGISSCVRTAIWVALAACVYELQNARKPNG